MSGASTAAPRRFASADEWRALAANFEAGHVPHGDWDHGAHLAMGVWYLLWHDFDTALDRVRRGIQALNAHHEAEGATIRVGYHETLTRLYMVLIHRALARHSHATPLVDVLNAVIEELNDRSIPFRYYTNERLFSREARADFVPPDVAPL
ncbi:MAG TPA: hypothetical protein VJ867_09120 [Gemmatimonadaceae bacterium]|nr:hypothetical protein [Gemmatimonadaceae bacterium]